MSHPYVTRVTFNNGQIVLTVEFDPTAAGQAFEISGYATQNGGAFASFYAVEVPAADPGGTVVAYVAAPPLQQFKSDRDVTVVLRAARVWATVLKQTPDNQMVPQGDIDVDAPAAQPGATWNAVKKVEWVSPAAAPAWNQGQAPAGDAGFPSSQSASQSAS